MPRSANVQQKILAAMEMRGRHSYSDIAAQLDVSQQLVQYHIEKAVREKVIMGFHAIVDLPLVRHSFNLLYLRFFGLSAKAEKQWFSETDRSSRISLVARTVGRWNATVAVVADSRRHLSQCITEITASIAGKVSELIVTTEVECTYSSLQLLHRLKPVQRKTSIAPASYQVDTTDLAILRALAANCRTSAAEIARQLNISPSTVQRRIEHLEETNIILGYRTQIDYEKFGYRQYRLLIKLSNLNPQTIERLKADILASGKAQSVSRFLGLADVDFRCHTKSLDELADFLGELRDKFADDIVQIEIVPLFLWKRINYFPVT